MTMEMSIGVNEVETWWFFNGACHLCSFFLASLRIPVGTGVGTSHLVLEVALRGSMTS